MALAPNMPTRAISSPPGGLARTARSRLTVTSFSYAVLLICICLQRFAIPVLGGLKLNLATPLVLGLAVWGLANRMLALDRRRTAFFFGICAMAAISLAAQVSVPVAIAPRVSMPSFAYWLLITGFAVLRFREPMDEEAFFRIASFCLTALAIAGIVEFVLQFVGLRLFQFSGLVPDKFLIEDLYAVVIPFGDSAMLRSNGFFLVEPSVFSQFMAIGIVVETLYTRHSRHLLRLGLCFAGLLVSLSGTGWMVLGSFVIVLAFTSGSRGLLSAAILIIGIALALGIGLLVVPDVTNGILDRTSEFTLPGTSGNERFVTPFMALNAVLDAAPWTFFTGIGPGASEQILVPFFYRLNTPVKILLEYGIGGLFFYLALLISGSRPRRQWLLLTPLLTLLLIAGGYHQFSPALFFVLLLGTVATLRPSPA